MTQFKNQDDKNATKAIQEEEGLPPATAAQEVRAYFGDADFASAVDARPFGGQNEIWYC